MLNEDSMNNENLYIEAKIKPMFLQNHSIILFTQRDNKVSISSKLKSVYSLHKRSQKLYCFYVTNNNLNPLFQSLCEKNGKTIIKDLSTRQILDVIDRYAENGYQILNIDKTTIPYKADCLYKTDYTKMNQLIHHSMNDIIRFIDAKNKEKQIKLDNELQNELDEFERI